MCTKKACSQRKQEPSRSGRKRSPSLSVPLVAEAGRCKGEEDEVWEEEEWEEEEKGEGEEEQQQQGGQEEERTGAMNPMQARRTGEVADGEVATMLAASVVKIRSTLQVEGNG